ncbi:hypothetical protein THAOC_32805 [Thalassiosira oceanica]|uniref:Choloylglycine hydrolase/NAAA C-terminal domain-containing protein n=2 Tax=Thalassiosira oceanica TaxID=159749 RepID=K0R8C9_THAOC|nr:hypothetical protein THAOC_32805 [Thalassiosira oceanica]|eukprot:EJK48399.1 hypothetical protein THAOC_32805 [Thalassiosira oceanica]
MVRFTPSRGLLLILAAASAARDAAVLACGNVRLDADLAETPDECGPSDSRLTSFQARTMELDRFRAANRALFALAANRTDLVGLQTLSPELGKTPGLVETPFMVEFFPTQATKEHACTPAAPRWKWRREIPFVGVTAMASYGKLEFKQTAEGMNKDGLTVSAQIYRGNVFPHNAVAEEWGLPGWVPDACLPYALLSKYSTVQQIRDEARPGGELANVYRWTVVDLGIPSYHWIVDDATGDHAVIEIVDEKLVFWNNSEIGTVTNDPSFAWHAQNINQYWATSEFLRPDHSLATTSPGTAADPAQSNIPAFGSLPASVGTGMNTRVLPGDYTSAGASTTSYAETFANVNALISQTFIPLGVVPGASMNYEWTAWTTMKVYGCGRRQFMYKGYFDLQWKVIDLSDVNFDHPPITINPEEGKETIEDLNLKPVASLGGDGPAAKKPLRMNKGKASKSKANKESNKE